MRSPEARKHSGAQLLERALDVVEAVTESPGITVGELAETLQIPESTVYRVVRILIARGLLVRYGREIYLGATTGTLAHAHRTTVLEPWMGRARTVLAALAEDVGATTVLTLPAGDHGVLIARHDAGAVLFTRVPTGSGFPLTQGAIGRVLLAHAAAPIREATLLELSSGRDHDRGSGPDTLRGELFQVQAQGYSFSRDEVQVGTMGYFAPVITQGSAVASVGIILPRAPLSSRTQRRLVSQTTDAAVRVGGEWASWWKVRRR